MSTLCFQKTVTWQNMSNGVWDQFLVIIQQLISVPWQVMFCKYQNKEVQLDFVFTINIHNDASFVQGFECWFQWLAVDQGKMSAEPSCGWKLKVQLFSADRCTDCFEIYIQYLLGLQPQQLRITGPSFQLLHRLHGVQRMCTVYTVQCSLYIVRLSFDFSESGLTWWLCL